MEGFPKQEKIPSPKERFIGKINETDISPLEFGDDLDTICSDAKVLLLGEMHGISENIRVIRELVDKYGFNKVGFEWKPDEEQAVREYVTSGSFNENDLALTDDGRLTAEHFKLALFLQELGIAFFSFDHSSGPGDWNERDRVMADIISASIDQEDKTLLVAGNLHASIDEVDLGDEGKGKPMGSHIKEKYGDKSETVRIEYLSGQINNMGVRDLTDIRDRFDIPDPRAVIFEGKNYIAIPEATPATTLATS